MRMGWLLGGVVCFGAAAVVGIRLRSDRGLRVAWDVWRAGHGGPEAIRARQQARFAGLVAYARSRSPYFARRYRGLPAHVELRQLPVTTKSELMAHFDEWVTDPAVQRDTVGAFISDPSRIGELYLGRYLVFTTSGTSGEPAILLQDRTVIAIYTALYVRGSLGVITLRDCWRILRGGARTAAVFATGGHFVSTTMFEYQCRQQPWRRRLRRYFSVLAPLPAIVEGLNAFQPALLGSYASMLALLAQEQEAGRLHIHPAMLSSAGETLAPTTKARIERAFGCPVHDLYSASEVIAITFDCAQGRLHVNTDWYIVEPVDEHYQPVPAGQPSSTVLVTNLANRVQPIIRYDLGDSVVMEPNACPCGSPFPVIRVEGRTDDILAFPAADGATVRVPPMALATVVEETPGVRRFQMIQTAPAALSVRLEVAESHQPDVVWAAVEQRLATYLGGLGLSHVTVLRAAEPPQLNPRSGKFRHVWAAEPAGAPRACTGSPA